MEKRSKLKVRKFWRLIPTFIEVTGEKLVEGEGFLPPPPPKKKLCNGFGKLLLIYTYFDSTYRDIRHSLNSEAIWWISCNLSRDKFESLLRICIICLCTSKFLTSLDGSSQNTLYWKTLNKLRHWLLWKHLLLALTNDLWLLLSLPKVLQDLSNNFSQVLFQRHILSLRSISDKLG